MAAIQYIRAIVDAGSKLHRAILEGRRADPGRLRPRTTGLEGVLKRMSSEQSTDDELMASLQRKDVSALEQLYDRHRVLAYSLAMRTLSNRSDAEDVVQEAFLNLWRASETFRTERSSPRSWLLAIVHHRCIDKLRSRQTRPQSVELEEGMNVAEGADVWREVSEALTRDDVRQALQQLPSEQRETIELAYFKGYTHTQIAQVMQVPLGTVKGRMRIGLHKLKSALEHQQAELAVD